MSLIQPFSDSNQYTSGGAWDCSSAAALTANFPSVKHWFPCNETSGTTLTDRTAQSVILTGASGMTFITNGVVPNRAAAGSTKTGTFYAIDNKPFLFLSVGAFTTGGITLGDVTGGPGITTGQSAATAIVDANSGVYPGTAYTNGGATVYGRALVVTNYNDASGMQTLECDTNATFSAKAATKTTDSTPTTPAQLALPTLDGGTKAWSAAATTTTALYGIGLFVFTTAPTAATIRNIISWHTYQWANGHKWIYPGLKGVS